MKVINKLADSRIARNTSTLALAQGASYALSIVYVAALARYVGVEGIGRISTATALTGLLVLVMGPGLKTLLVRDVAADHEKAASYASNMLFLTCLLGVPFILLIVGVAQIARYPGDTVAIVYVYTVVYLLQALSAIPLAVFQAFERMEYEAASLIVREVANVSLSLLAIYLNQSLLMIVFVSAIAQALKLLFALSLMYRRFVRAHGTISFTASKTLLISSFPFGAALILSVARAQLGTVVLSLYHPEDVVGVYSAASSLLATILLFIGAFSSAIFPTFSSLHVHNRHALQRFYQICYKYLLVVGFPLALGTMLVGDRVILLIYGDQFGDSATIIRILAVYLLTIAGYSNGPLLNATGRQRFFAWTQGLAVCATGILCLLLIPTWGPVGAAIAFVSPAVVTFFVHSIAGHRQFGLSLPWLTMGRVLLATLLMGLAVSVSLWFGMLWLVVVLVVAPSVYGLAILLLGIVRREELKILAGAPSFNRSTTERILT